METTIRYHGAPLEDSRIKRKGAKRHFEPPSLLYGSLPPPLPPLHSLEVALQRLKPHNTFFHALIVYKIAPAIEGFRGNDVGTELNLFKSLGLRVHLTTHLGFHPPILFKNCKVTVNYRQFNSAKGKKN